MEATSSTTTDSAPVCGRSECQVPARFRVTMKSPSDRTWVAHCCTLDHGMPAGALASMGFEVVATEQLPAPANHVHAWDGAVVVDPVTAMTLAVHLEAAGSPDLTQLAAALRTAATTARDQVNVPLVHLPARVDKAVLA